MAHDFNKKLYFLMKTMIYTLPHEKKSVLILGLNHNFLLYFDPLNLNSW